MDTDLDMTIDLLEPVASHEGGNMGSGLFFSQNHVHNSHHILQTPLRLPSPF